MTQDFLAKMLPSESYDYFSQIQKSPSSTDSLVSFDNARIGNELGNESNIITILDNIPFQDILNDRVTSLIAEFERQILDENFNSIDDYLIHLASVWKKVSSLLDYEAVNGVREGVEARVRELLLSPFKANIKIGVKDAPIGKPFDAIELKEVTTFWADRVEKTRGGRSAVEFLKRVYGQHGLGNGLNKVHIRKHDPKLYMALLNWARDVAKKQELDELLPSGQEKYMDDVVTDEEMNAHRKVRAVYMRKLRA